MSTNLSGNALTLGSTSLNEETLKAIKSYYYVPDNCSVGDTVILDGIECLCIATGVTIQGSSLRRIAIDKNHDLGYYQKYVGITIDGTVISQINSWRWGGYGTKLGNTSKAVGYGLQNTINCLANTVNYTKGTWTDTVGDGYPWLWRGVNDFRSSHSDKWFVPSISELRNYVCTNKSNLTFDSTSISNRQYWSSSEENTNDSCNTTLDSAKEYSAGKYFGLGARLCRAF